MRKLFAALVALSLAFAPLAQAAEVVSGVAPGNGKPPAITPGGSWNGTTTIIQPGDSDGNPYVRPWAPNFELIEQKMNTSLGSGVSDSSLVPVAASGYRQVFALVRVKSASFAAAGALEVGARGHLVAATDSTQLGFFFTMGNGIKNGRTKYLVTLGDRWFTVPLVDSISGASFPFPYIGHYVTNRTGATAVLDIQLWGIRW